MFINGLYPAGKYWSPGRAPPTFPERLLNTYLAIPAMPRSDILKTSQFDVPGTYRINIRRAYSSRSSQEVPRQTFRRFSFFLNSIYNSDAYLKPSEA